MGHVGATAGKPEARAEGIRVAFLAADRIPSAHASGFKGIVDAARMMAFTHDELRPDEKLDTAIADRRQTPRKKCP
jgi:hypothetical protein